MVLPGHHQARHLLARGFQRVGIGLRLALELGRLEFAPGQHQRRPDAIDVQDGAELVDLAGRQGHVGRARAQHHRAQVVHAAHQQAALDHVGRQPVRRPVGGGQHAGHVAARGMAGDMDVVRVAAQARDVGVQPGDGAACLRHHFRDAHLGDGGEVQHREHRARGGEAAHQEGLLVLGQVAPAAAMHVHVHRRGPAAARQRQEQVQRLVRRGPVGDVGGVRELGARLRAVGAVGRDHGIRVRRPCALVVGAVQLRLGVVEVDLGFVTHRSLLIVGLSLSADYLRESGCDQREVTCPSVTTSPNRKRTFASVASCAGGVCEATHSCGTTQ